MSDCKVIHCLRFSMRTSNLHTNANWSEYPCSGSWVNTEAQRTVFHRNNIFENSMNATSTFGFWIFPQHVWERCILWWERVGDLQMSAVSMSWTCLEHLYWFLPYPVWKLSGMKVLTQIVVISHFISIGLIFITCR